MGRDNGVSEKTVRRTEEAVRRAERMMRNGRRVVAVDAASVPDSEVLTQCGEPIRFTVSIHVLESGEFRVVMNGGRFAQADLLWALEALKCRLLMTSEFTDGDGEVWIGDGDQKDGA